MTNIFKTIGNNLEKKQLEKKKVNEKYWKLSSIERIEYDMHFKNIIEKYKYNWILLKTWFYSMLYLTIGLILFGIVYDKLDTAINLINSVEYIIIDLIWLPILVDIIVLIENICFEGRDKKKLNKRFKLC
jgi:hypothetical protein